MAVVKEQIVRALGDTKKLPTMDLFKVCRVIDILTNTSWWCCVQVVISGLKCRSSPQVLRTLYDNLEIIFLCNLESRFQLGIYWDSKADAARISPEEHAWTEGQAGSVSTTSLNCNDDDIDIINNDNNEIGFVGHSDLYVFFSQRVKSTDCTRTEANRSSTGDSKFCTSLYNTLSVKEGPLEKCWGGVGNFFALHLAWTKSFTSIGTSFRHVPRAGFF